MFSAVGSSFSLTTEQKKISSVSLITAEKRMQLSLLFKNLLIFKVKKVTLGHPVFNLDQICLFRQAYIVVML